MSTDSREVLLAQRSQVFLEIARLLGRSMGTCKRRNIGAVLVVNGRIREVGWNGMERDDAPTCVSGACPRGGMTAEEQPHGIGYSNCIYIHAEYNVLYAWSQNSGIKRREDWATGVLVYVSDEPCEDCVRYAQWAGCTLVWGK